MKQILITFILFFNFQVIANSDIFNKIITDMDTAITHIKTVQIGDKKSLTNFIKSWKKVESSYILFDLDEDYFDSPRYIDVFHNTRKSIASQLTPILKSSDNPQIALYKNAYKTINGLEFMVLQNNTKRNQNIINIIKNNILKHLKHIKQGYINNQNEFNNQQKIQALLLNILASETYKLKEWRIGDVVGLSKKYNTKDISRSEYFLSKNSLSAIVSILENQKQILDLSFSQNTKIKQEIQTAFTIIDAMITIAKNIKNDDFSNNKKLYDLGNQLLKMYQITIMNKLDFVAKILDADGD